MPLPVLDSDGRPERHHDGNHGLHRSPSRDRYVGHDDHASRPDSRCRQTANGRNSASKPPDDPPAGTRQPGPSQRTPQSQTQETPPSQLEPRTPRRWTPPKRTGRAATGIGIRVFTRAVVRGADALPAHVGRCRDDASDGRYLLGYRLELFSGPLMQFGGKAAVHQGRSIPRRPHAARGPAPAFRIGHCGLASILRGLFRWASVAVCIPARR